MNEQSEGWPRGGSEPALSLATRWGLGVAVVAAVWFVLSIAFGASTAFAAEPPDAGAQPAGASVAGSSRSETPLRGLLSFGVDSLDSTVGDAGGAVQGAVSDAASTAQSIADAAPEPVARIVAVVNIVPEATASVTGLLTEQPISTVIAPISTIIAPASGVIDPLIPPAPVGSRAETTPEIFSTPSAQPPVVAGPVSGAMFTGGSHPPIAFVPVRAQSSTINAAPAHPAPPRQLPLPMPFAVQTGGGSSGSASGAAAPVVLADTTHGALVPPSFAASLVSWSSEAPPSSSDFDFDTTPD